MGFGMGPNWVDNGVTSHQGVKSRMETRTVQRCNVQDAMVSACGARKYLKGSFGGGGGEGN